MITIWNIILISFFYRGTKSYIVSVSESENGPWKEIKSGTLVDPRPRSDPQDLETFQIHPVLAHYVKFSCTSYYGEYCALGYIEVFGKANFWQ